MDNGKATKEHREKINLCDLYGPWLLISIADVIEYKSFKEKSFTQQPKLCGFFTAVAEWKISVE